MHHLQRISWAITLIGLVIITASWLLDLDSVWLLAGLLLAWAGIIKITVTIIWHRVAHMGTDDHRPTPGL